MDECRCRRSAGKAKCRTLRVRRKVSDDQRGKAGHRYLRERSGVADGATAAGRTHGRAGKNPHGGTQSDRIDDAGTSKTLNGATGASDMAGEAARVAVERSGSCRDTRADPPTSRDRGTTARPAFVTLRHGKQERGKAEWGANFEMRNRETGKSNEQQRTENGEMLPGGECLE